jgi:hypothetical protein
MRGNNPAEGSGLVNGLQPNIRDLVERLASGPTFGKSSRLRALFLFLCDRKATDPEGTVHEQEIGVAIFNRRPDYSTAEDPIVRVHVSQLRKRLEQYFASEGRDEPVVIEIPKGSYAPVFHSRDSYFPPGRVPELFRLHLPPHGKRRVAALVVLAVGGVLLVVGLVFGLWNLVSSTRPARNLEMGATVERLWVQMFDNGRPTCIVLSDVVLGLFEDAIQYQLSLNEYRDKDFSRLSGERLKDPVEIARWKVLVGEYFTHISDARSAATFSVLNAGRNLPTEIVFAGDFAVNYLQSHNLILVGTRRTNPWVDIFENQLNFQSVFREMPSMLCYFQNRSPLPGESANYEVQWTKQGFCRVAFLPSPSRKGNVLLISGTDMATTEAGGQFISSERWVQTLGSTLGLSQKAPFPYFEVLLKIDYMTRGAPKFELVAHRIYKF